MDEATTRHRAPSPSNTRKFVEADARSTDLLPKSSTSHARGPSTNFPQVRDEPEFILHDLAGPYPAYNSPSRPAQRPTRYKTLPASGLGRPTRYKTLPASPKMPISGHFSHAGRTFYRFRHQQPEQGELYPACGATSGTKLSQHARLGGPPGTKLSQQAARRPTRYKTLPASPKTPISAHFSHAGRTLYRFRHQHDKQGEKSHAPTPHRTHQRAPPQISHAIRLNELSTKPRNVAIPTT